jgi:hypothetical protein
VILSFAVFANSAIQRKTLLFASRVYEDDAMPGIGDDFYVKSGEIRPLQ